MFYVGAIKNSRKVTASLLAPLFDQYTVTYSTVFNGNFSLDPKIPDMQLVNA